MSLTDEALAADFDAHRHRLIGLAYRLTGGLADAEDAVQETWLRLAGLDIAARDEIRELGAWLTTVVGRICIDRMRSAAVRREQYVGPWLPEPVVTTPDSDDPLNVVVSRDELRMAAMRVLHELSPDQRLAFVLHDSFDVPFAEIADVLGCTVAAARQHASRARKAMTDAGPAPRVPLPEQQRVIEEFLVAVSSRDINAVSRILHPDAVLFGDSGGKARTARRPIVGLDKVARFFTGLAEKYRDQAETALAHTRLVLVNGDLGVVLPALPEVASSEQKIAPRVVTFGIVDGKAAAIFDVVNPDKLTHVQL